MDGALRVHALIGGWSHFGIDLQLVFKHLQSGHQLVLLDDSLATTTPYMYIVTTPLVVSEWLTIMLSLASCRAAFNTSCIHASLFSSSCSRIRADWVRVGGGGR